jgi:SPOR domain
MTDTRAALGSDRLPWLTDELTRPRKRGARGLLLWGAAAIALVAGASYWLGMQTQTSEPGSTVTFQQTLPPATTARPEAQVLPPAEQVQLAPPPEVRPAPTPEVRSARSPVVRPAPERRAIASTEEAAASVAATEDTSENSQSPAAKEEETKRAPSEAATASKAGNPPAIAPAKSLTYWPSRVTSGAYGRVVQIGAFGSRDQAKNGWAHMARAYPGVKRLPAVVVEARNSKGRPFYRFQIGTTSQAHSEVLCQRMQKISFSCAVVGLPWKPKGVER